MNKAGGFAILAVAASVVGFAAATAGSNAAPSAAPNAPSSVPVNQRELDELARALSAEGRIQASTFSGVRVDARQNLVWLYATSEAGAKSLVAATMRTDPGLNANRVTTAVAPYSRRTLDSAAAKLSKNRNVQHGYEVNTVAVAPDATGLIATSSAAYAHGSTVADKNTLYTAEEALSNVAGVRVAISYSPAVKAA